MGRVQAPKAHSSDKLWGLMLVWGGRLMLGESWSDYVKLGESGHNMMPQTKIWPSGKRPLCLSGFCARTPTHQLASIEKYIIQFWASQ